ALRDIYDIAMNGIDRTADILPEVRAEDRSAGRGVGILDGRDLFAKLVGNDLGMPRGEIGDLPKGLVQTLLHANKTGNYGVGLVRSDASDLARRGIIEQFANREWHAFSPLCLLPRSGRHQPYASLIAELLPF